MKDVTYSVESIAVRGIRALGRHGPNAGEQSVPQPLNIDVHLTVDVSAARTSDALADTVDFAAMHARIVELVATERYQLLERLGEAVLRAVMDDKRIGFASVTIEQPGLLDGATPSVSVSSMRESMLGRPRKGRKRDKK